VGDEEDDEDDEVVGARKKVVGEVGRQRRSRHGEDLLKMRMRRNSGGAKGEDEH